MKDTIRRVLVTGAGALLGQGIIRALRNSPRRYHIIAVDPSPLAVGLYWADTAHLVPMASSTEYLPRIQDLLRDEKPDALLVGTDVELETLASARSALEAEYGARIIVSTPEVVRMADDKLLTAEFLREKGFPFPRTVLASSWEDCRPAFDGPFIIKPRRGARSVGVERLVSHTELTSRLNVLDGKTDLGSLVVQECVGDSDREFTTGVLCFAGKTRAIITLKRTLRDGNTYRASPVNLEAVDALLSNISDVIQPYGPLNMQFRLDPQGKPVIFEFNARFSGTTPFRHHCGFPEVEMCLDFALDGTLPTQPPVQDKTILRYWTEEVLDRDLGVPPSGLQGLGGGS